MFAPLETLNLRISDDFGLGHFGAPRGSRTHRGTDYKAITGTSVKAPFLGYISKIGFAYVGNTEQKYIEVTSIKQTNKRVRIFYIKNPLAVDNIVEEGAHIANVGNISKKYDTATRKMDNHIHYETIIDDIHVDSALYLKPRKKLKKKIPWLILILVPASILGIWYLSDF
jgi:murein DD-endopeptidase MepM/ murein hydrolase activator NlpD